MARRAFQSTTTHFRLLLLFLIMTFQKIRLFCLPYAGGNRFSYKLYKEHFPEYVELYPLDYPGHGARMKETPLTDLQQIARDVYEQIKDQLHTPYAIYGHSMGARVGYLLAREIMLRQRPLPVRLFFSSSEAPSVQSPHAGKHLLPRTDFFQALKEMGGMPDEVLQYPDLLSLFEPVLRADFQAISEYRHQHAEPLNIPMTVMTGNEEELSPGDVEKWQHESLHAVSLRYFEGGHFFILQHAPRVAAEMMQELNATPS
jgi:surfactin synthase thioesterase subunit